MVDIEGSSTPITADRAYIAESIALPLAKIVKTYQGVMPPFQLKDSQVDDIITYMKTISKYTKPSEMPGATTQAAPATQPATTGATTKRAI
jgi:hypothetical protein